MWAQLLCRTPICFFPGPCGLLPAALSCIVLYFGDTQTSLIRLPFLPNLKPEVSLYGYLVGSYFCMPVYFRRINPSLQNLSFKCLNICKPKAERLVESYRREKDTISKCLPTMFLYTMAILVKLAEMNFIVHKYPFVKGGEKNQSTQLHTTYL